MGERTGRRDEESLDWKVGGGLERTCGNLPYRRARYEVSFCGELGPVLGSDWAIEADFCQSC